MDLRSTGGETRGKNPILDPGDPLGRAEHHPQPSEGRKNKRKSQKLRAGVSAQALLLFIGCLNKKPERTRTGNWGKGEDGAPKKGGLRPPKNRSAPKKYLRFKGGDCANLQPRCVTSL